MTAPVWLNAVIGDFGRAAGIGALALNERGAAALRFENGTSLRLEYTGAELVVAVTVPSADLKRLLSFSHPKARYGFRVRTGIVPKTREAVLAVRLAERDVTLPRVNAVFGLLWRLAGETGGASWA
jgi:type III secretion system chaperone SycN